jgi:dolichol-phosphate mannosyltransferase
MAEPTGPVLVVIPTYDERDNLRPVLARLHRSVPDADVLVVDDASPDGTGELAEQMAADDPRIQVLHRTGKSGLGAAYLAGFARAMQSDYRLVVQMDADGSHPPEALPALLEALQQADLVLGSRYVSGGEVRNWPAHREWLSRGGNLYSRTALGIPVRDVTAGYRAFRRQVLAELDLGAVSSQGYCFQIDMTWRAIQAGFRVVEVPITFTERERGRSKMSGAIVAEALWQVARWGTRRVLRRGGPDAAAAAPERPDEPAPDPVADTVPDTVPDAVTDAVKGDDAISDGPVRAQ